MGSDAPCVGFDLPDVILYYIKPFIRTCYALCYSCKIISDISPLGLDIRNDVSLQPVEPVSDVYIGSCNDCQKNNSAYEENASHRVISGL